MCALKFLTPRKLRKHKKMAHVFTKTFPCHFCDELFTSECSVSFFPLFYTKFRLEERDGSGSKFNFKQGGGFVSLANSSVNIDVQLKT